MDDILAGMLNADTFTLSIVFALAGAAALLIQLTTESTMLALWYAPAMVIMSLFSISTARVFDITLTAYQDTNTILSACAGAIIGMFLMIVLTRLYYMVFDIKRAVRNNNPTDYSA